jgi:hypothetical protein
MTHRRQDCGGAAGIEAHSGERWPATRLQGMAAVQCSSGDGKRWSTFGSASRCSWRCRLHLKALRRGETTEVNAGGGGARLGSSTGGAAQAEATGG